MYNYCRVDACSMRVLGVFCMHQLANTGHMRRIGSGFGSVQLNKPSPHPLSCLAYRVFLDSHRSDIEVGPLEADIYSAKLAQLFELVMKILVRRTFCGRGFL